ncbi:MAG: GntR family transcriptional regulator [Planctomycetaceae bacterium]|nr:GntR family transcriptional regulator [Planctomycetaceae bacterium]
MPAPDTDLSDDVVARLEQLILTGTLKPGEKVLEQALSARLGVSRGPLREAIRTLEARRLLQRKPFAGVRVAKFTIDEIDELLITREALEGMACRLAAENMTLREIRQLRASCDALNELVASAGVAAAFQKGRDDDLHLQIAQGSHNRLLADMICRDLYPLLGLFRYYTAQLRGGDFASSFRQHSGIIAAIERRQPDLAEQRMRKHIAQSRELVLRRLRQSTTD